MTRKHESSTTRRMLRHVAADQRGVTAAFPPDALQRIENAIAQGERTHRGQVRFAVEAALPLGRIARRLSPRERALEIFGLSRTWDTEENCGVLVYLLLADRDVEIVADRGIHRRVEDGTWESICATMEQAFGAGRFSEGVLAGIEGINQVLSTHFPCKPGEASNELPDAPLVL